MYDTKRKTYEKPSLARQGVLPHVTAARPSPITAKGD
jgi:hypothetical protein